jgi:hypothetical protein
MSNNEVSSYCFQKSSLMINTFRVVRTVFFIFWVSHSCFSQSDTETEKQEVSCERIQTRRQIEIKRVLLKSCRIDLTTTISSAGYVFTDPDETVNEVYADGNLNIKFLPLRIHETYPNLLTMSFW